MPDIPNIEKLERFFGSRELAEKWRRKLAEAKSLSEETLRKIKELAREILPQRDDFRFEYTDINGKTYHVVLVQIPNTPMVKPTSTGNYKLGVIWPGATGIGGPWLSAFFEKKKDVEELASRPNDYFLLVGRLKNTEVGGKPMWSMNVLAYIPIDIDEVSKPQEEEQPAEEEIEEGEIEVEGTEIEEAGEG